MTRRTLAILTAVAFVVGLTVVIIDAYAIYTATEEL